MAVEANVADRAADLRDQTVGVVGLGYVGLPLALSLEEAGLTVMGSDSNRDRAARIRAGESPIDDISNERLAAAVVSPHRVIDWDAVFRNADRILDTVNVSRGRTLRSRQVLRLGAGRSAA